ncbi:MAG: HAMP domain-containing protein [Dokdonella sp.]|nr:HAMP domain-containing protein [Dokdonella sp.]
MAARDALNLLLRRVVPALVVAALLAASLKLAEDAAADNARFAAHYQLVLGTALVALVVLVLVIGLRLWRLRGEVRRGVPGARLNRRLLGLLIVLALPASLVVYGFALRFLDATIDNWFNVRLEQALDDALELGRVVVDEHLHRAEAASNTLAQELARTPLADTQAALDAAIDALGATQLAVLGTDSRVLALASSDPDWLDPPLPDAALQLRVRGDQRYAAAEPFGDALLLRIVLPIDSSHVAPERQRLLQALFPLPARVQPLTRGIERASFDFQRLKFLRGSLKLTFALILTFVLLLTALAVVLVAFVVARRLVAPISRLAAATRAVAAGRFDTPLPAASNDELGFLVTSFAQMTRELEQAGARAALSTREIEQQRAWLEAVLERLSAGVLGFDHDGHLRSANAAAEAILGVVITRQLGASPAEIGKAHASLRPFFEPLGRHLREGAREWREEVVLESVQGPRTLMVRGAALPEHAGYVAVFDDLTVLNRAQRATRPGRGRAAPRARGHNRSRRSSSWPSACAADSSAACRATRAS